MGYVLIETPTPDYYAGMVDIANGLGLLPRSTVIVVAGTLGAVVDSDAVLDICEGEVIAAVKLKHEQWRRDQGHAPRGSHQPFGRAPDLDPPDDTDDDTDAPDDDDRDATPTIVFAPD